MSWFGWPQRPHSFNHLIQISLYWIWWQLLSTRQLNMIEKTRKLKDDVPSNDQTKLNKWRGQPLTLLWTWHQTGKSIVDRSLDSNWNHYPRRSKMSKWRRMRKLNGCLHLPAISQGSIYNNNTVFLKDGRVKAKAEKLWGMNKGNTRTFLCIGNEETSFVLFRLREISQLYLDFIRQNQTLK